MKLIKRVLSAPFRYAYSFFIPIFNMHFLSHVSHRENLRVGNNSHWNRGVYINALGGVSIGENVIIGPYTVIISADHKFTDSQEPIWKQGYVLKPVSIGSGCWIGAHATILGGVVLGEGCVVGAGAIVTKSMPAYSIVVGNPAKIIGFRFTKNEGKNHD